MHACVDPFSLCIYMKASKPQQGSSAAYSSNSRTAIRTCARAHHIQVRITRLGACYLNTTCTANNSVYFLREASTKLKGFRLQDESP